VNGKTTVLTEDIKEAIVLLNESYKELSIDSKTREKIGEYFERIVSKEIAKTL